METGRLSSIQGYDGVKRIIRSGIFGRDPHDKLVDHAILPGLARLEDASDLVPTRISLEMHFGRMT